MARVKTSSVVVEAGQIEVYANPAELPVQERTAVEGGARWGLIAPAKSHNVTLFGESAVGMVAVAMSQNVTKCHTLADFD